MAETAAPAETWVSFSNGQKMPMAWRLDTGRFRAFQARLKLTHGLRPRPHCDCRVDGRYLELQVVRRATGDEARPVVRFHLARMPQEGPRHRPACFFYGADPDQSGAAGYVAGVIGETQDGTTLLRLARSLSIPRKPEPNAGAELVPVTPDGRAGKATRRAMSPLGLLHLLWEKAGLANWHPGFTGKRAPWQIAYRLEEAAQAIRCGRVSLDEQLTVIVPGSRRHAAALLEATELSAGKRFQVLVGTIHTIDMAKQLIGLAGALPPAYSLFLNCTAPRIADMLSRFPYAARLLALAPDQRPAQVVGLFVVKAITFKGKYGPSVRADVELAGLMEVSADCVPVASGLELQVAERLVREGRQFQKPLRYDAEADLVFPDFILLDTADIGGHPMEVFGRDDEAYRLRRVEKERYYAETFGRTGWWHWVAAGPSATQMPALPPRC